MRTRKTLLMLTVCALTVLPLGMFSLPGFQPMPALAGSITRTYHVEVTDVLHGVSFQMIAQFDRDGNFHAVGNPPPLLGVFPGTPLFGTWKPASSNSVRLKAESFLFTMTLDGGDGVLESRGKAAMEGTLPLRKDAFEGDVTMKILDPAGQLVQEIGLHLIGAKD